MKIVACLSSHFHPELPVKIKLNDGTIETDCRGPAIEAVNYSDRCALEEALRIKEGYGDVEIVAVMSGPPDYRWVLESCAFCEIDQAVYLQVSDWALMDSYGCSLILSDFIRKVEPHMVLCGDANKDFESGQVGPILAELLAMPYVSRAIGLSLFAGRTTLEVERKLMRGNRLKLRAPFPVVVSMDPAANQPRYISVHSRIRSQLAKRVTAIPINRPNYEAGQIKPINFVHMTSIGPVRVRPKKAAAPDSTMSAQERLAFLMTGGIKEPSTEGKALVEGSVEKQADAIIEFLKNNLP